MPGTLIKVWEAKSEQSPSKVRANFASHTLIKVPGTLIKVWEAKFFESPSKVRAKSEQSPSLERTLPGPPLNFARPPEKLCLSDSGVQGRSQGTGVLRVPAARDVRLRRAAGDPESGAPGRPRGPNRH